MVRACEQCPTTTPSKRRPMRWATVARQVAAARRRRAGSRPPSARYGPCSRAGAVTPPAPHGHATAASTGARRSRASRRGPSIPKVCGEKARRRFPPQGSIYFRYPPASTPRGGACSAPHAWAATEAATGRRPPAARTAAVSVSVSAGDGATLGDRSAPGRGRPSAPHSPPSGNAELHGPSRRPPFDFPLAPVGWKRQRTTRRRRAPYLLCRLGALGAPGHRPYVVSSYRVGRQHVSGSAQDASRRCATLHHPFRSPLPRRPPSTVAASRDWCSRSRRLLRVMLSS